jgi:hypothetical protein
MEGKLPDGSALGDIQFDPGVDGSLATTGANIGQGTTTKGGVNVDAIKGYSDYTEDTDAKGKPIKITFDSGMVKSINF